jgi:peptidoglycan/xylan/chitin deacetylase (PgdA/CDA1 family)
MFPPTHREVAITFDDLPQSFERLEAGKLIDLHRKLLTSITANDVPAVGFVNEGVLSTAKERIMLFDILQMWLDAGFELGNHTFSHLYFYETPLHVYEEDVIRGEAMISLLQGGRSTRPRYFRHPHLSTGPDLATKRAFERFLAERNYQVAPVTIDSMEWLFATAYSKATLDRDRRTRQLVVNSYVPYMEEVFEFYERLSMAVIGQEFPQVLLLHADWLNANHFDELCVMIKHRGYTFISLEQALQHPAYQLPDNYIGPTGISWLQRWALTKGDGYRKEPGLPEFMKQFDDSFQSASAYKTI